MMTNDGDADEDADVGDDGDDDDDNVDDNNECIFNAPHHLSMTNTCVRLKALHMKHYNNTA